MVNYFVFTSSQTDGRFVISCDMLANPKDYLFFVFVFFLLLLAWRNVCPQEQCLYLKNTQPERFII